MSDTSGRDRVKNRALELNEVCRDLAYTAPTVIAKAADEVRDREHWQAPAKRLAYRTLRYTFACLAAAHNSLGAEEDRITFEELNNLDGFARLWDGLKVRLTKKANLSKQSTCDALRIDSEEFESVLAPWVKERDEDAHDVGEMELESIRHLLRALRGFLQLRVVSVLKCGRPISGVRRIRCLPWVGFWSPREEIRSLVSQTMPEVDVPFLELKTSDRVLDSTIRWIRLDPVLFLGKLESERHRPALLLWTPLVAPDARRVTNGCSYSDAWDSIADASPNTWSEVSEDYDSDHARWCHLVATEKRTFGLTDGQTTFLRSAGFTVLDGLGVGATGGVVKVENKNKETLALKFLRRLDALSDAEQRLLDELSRPPRGPWVRYRKESRLDRPPYYVVMDFVPGVSLREAILDARIDRIELANNLCRGVAQLHSAGLAHRDLHPDNVIVKVDEHGAPTTECVLIDFGVARAPLRAAHTGTHSLGAGLGWGVPPFAPRRQRAGSLSSDEWMGADVHALAWLLVAVLTGKELPTEGTSATVREGLGETLEEKWRAIADWIDSWRGMTGEDALRSFRALSRGSSRYPGYTVAPGWRWNHALRSECHSWDEAGWVENDRGLVALAMRMTKERAGSLSSSEIDEWTRRSHLPWLATLLASRSDSKNHGWLVVRDPGIPVTRLSQPTAFPFKNVRQRLNLVRGLLRICVDCASIRPGFAIDVDDIFVGPDGAPIVLRVRRPRPTKPTALSERLDAWIAESSAEPLDVPGRIPFAEDPSESSEPPPVSVSVPTAGGAVPSLFEWLRDHAANQDASRLLEALDAETHDFRETRDATRADGIARSAIARLEHALEGLAPVSPEAIDAARRTLEDLDDLLGPLVRVDDARIDRLATQVEHQRRKITERTQTKNAYAAARRRARSEYERSERARERDLAAKRRMRIEQHEARVLDARAENAAPDPLDVSDLEYVETSFEQWAHENNQSDVLSFAHWLALHSKGWRTDTWAGDWRLDETTGQVVEHIEVNPLAVRWELHPVPTSRDGGDGPARPPFAWTAWLNQVRVDLQHEKHESAALDSTHVRVRIAAMARLESLCWLCVCFDARATGKTCEELRRTWSSRMCTDNAKYGIGMVEFFRAADAEALAQVLESLYGNDATRPVGDSEILSWAREIEPVLLRLERGGKGGEFERPFFDGTPFRWFHGPVPFDESLAYYGAPPDAPLTKKNFQDASQPDAERESETRQTVR